jgi:hypothetical protein
MTGIKPIIFLLAALVVGAVIYKGVLSKNFNQSQTVSPSILQNSTVTPNQDNKQIVPLPSEEDIIRIFFNLINEKRVPEAIAMMVPSEASDESAKQAWGVQFNAFEKVTVSQITPSMKEEWKNDNHTYKVTLNVAMKPTSANAPIPYYGFDNGENIRWVTIERISSEWKISGIATGP